MVDCLIPCDVPPFVELFDFFRYSLICRLVDSIVYLYRFVGQPVSWLLKSSASFSDFSIWIGPYSQAHLFLRLFSIVAWFELINWIIMMISMAGQQGNRRTMGLRVPFILLLLLIVSCGVAQARSTAVLDLDTSEVRDPGTIYKEQITSSKIPVPLGKGSPLCSACKNFTNEAVSYLSEKQTQDKIMEILHDACSQTFSLEQKCVELVDSYATLLFAKITEIKPEEFCKQYGLCRDVTFLSGVKSDSTCVFCHHLVDEFLSKLKDPDAEFEIIQLLLKECNKIEGHAQQCKRMVLQYIPLILVNGEKFLEKNDVCALTQACDASKKRRIVGSFSEGGLVSDA